MSLQIYQDVEIDHSEVQTAKNARKKLEEKIAVRGMKNFHVKSATDKLEHLEAQAMTECDDFIQKNSKISDWVDE